MNQAASGGSPEPRPNPVQLSTAAQVNIGWAVGLALVGCIFLQWQLAGELSSTIWVACFLVLWILTFVAFRRKLYGLFVGLGLGIGIGLLLARLLFGS